jgi:hypothetical protein
MLTRRRQSGMSIFGIIAILIMLGFFAMCIIRMSPPYFEFLSVRDIIERVVMDPDTVSASPGTTRRKLANTFNTNQIYELDYKEVKIFSKSGKKYIDARYEVRLPVVWRIDMVLKFDDLFYQVGDIRPVTDPVLLRSKK